MENILQLLVTKLHPIYIFVLIILYGVWKLVGRGLTIFTEHGSKLTDGINAISSDIRGIRADLGVVVNKLGEHEQRISRLEDK